MIAQNAAEGSVGRIVDLKKEEENTKEIPRKRTPKSVLQRESIGRKEGRRARKVAGVKEQAINQWGLLSSKGEKH